jgi:hypothetical protein
MNIFERANIELELDNVDIKLTEALEPAVGDFLARAMENDDELVEFLNTPADKLPARYLYLMIELPRWAQNATLLDVINMARQHGLKGYFSVDGNNRLIGYVAYKVEKDCIVEIKIFSLRPKENNITLWKDLDLFIKENKSKYNKIQWTAVKENVDACRMYDFAIKKYNGIKEDWIHPATHIVNTNVWRYTIEN